MMREETVRKIGSVFTDLTDVVHYEEIADRSGVSASSVMVAAQEGFLDRYSMGHYTPTTALRRYLRKPEPVEVGTTTTSTAAVATSNGVGFDEEVRTTAIKAFIAVYEVLYVLDIEDASDIAEACVRELVKR